MWHLSDQVLLELVLHKSRTSDDEALDNVKVDVVRVYEGQHDLLKELLDTLLILRDIAAPLPGDLRLDPLPHKGHALSDKAHVGKTLLQHHGSHLGILRFREKERRKEKKRRKKKKKRKEKKRKKRKFCGK